MFIEKELMLEIMPLEFNECYDEYYETKIASSLSIGYCYNVLYNGVRVGCGARHLNIYEWADKCKEWALIKGYEIYSKRTKNKGVAKIKKYINGSKRKKLICCKIADTEVEAIFDICKWILENN